MKGWLFGILVWLACVAMLVGGAALGQAKAEAARPSGPGQWDQSRVCVKLNGRSAERFLQVRRAVRVWNRSQDHVTLHIEAKCPGEFKIVVFTYRGTKSTCGIFVGCMFAETVITGPYHTTFGRVKIGLSTRYAAQSRCWRRSASAHEFGHALGLPHSIGGQSLMWPVITDDEPLCGIPGHADLAYLDSIY